ncbi:GMC oxidoreductase [Spirosoma montaniterrae]|uniref:GMC family oxidoreductase n=1 Tax=Spirosoma montaniterrae TaxID=1178516 RepID=A0A1P9WZJ4_9BACT|nr:GMC family oxidoreductase [Spirosoma montaniterrae]AQG80799.1 GMC family oxidoreductase [Spirosoma montaniterrae]
MSTQRYDAIVVGSGITGGWAAKELTQKGLRVLLLERGRLVEHVKDYPTANWNPWEVPRLGRDTQAVLQDYPIQSNNYAFGPATQQFYVKDTESPYTQKQPFWWIRGYQTGGKSLLWGRATYRWSDLDFTANARDGYGTDWPIRYTDLAPWYSYVERYVGISGSKENLPQLPDSEFLPPFELNCVEKHMKGKLEAAFPERRMTIQRVAHLTTAHRGRGLCQARSLCERGCPYGGYFSSVSATIPDAQRTGRLTLRPNSIVTEVLFDPKTQRATGVRVLDAETRQWHEFSARLLFLNAGTLNTTWLLLNSTSNRFPNGFGNDSGVLGHYLMDHQKNIGAWGTVDGFLDKYHYGRRPTDCIIPRFRNVSPATSRTDFLRGYTSYGGASRAGWGRVLNQPGFGADLKEQATQPGPWSAGLRAYGECLPYFDNQVMLNRQLTDAWGLPTLTIDARFRENEAAMRKDMGTTSAEMLEAMGVKNVQIRDDVNVLGFSIHEMGTARMGRDPKTSMLNSHNQLHAAKNVFITDGSCMASSASQNPSLTYMALTARAADFAGKEMKRGNL